jgi:hypothetical protein
VRGIRMLRAMRRGLETESRTTLAGHEGGNPGDGQGRFYGSPRQSSTLPPSDSSVYRAPAPDVCTTSNVSLAALAARRGSPRGIPTRAQLLRL